MVTLPAPPGHKRATYDCKPLRVLWERYPGVYTPENTVMVDDLRRNYGEFSCFLDLPVEAKTANQPTNQSLTDNSQN